MLQRSPDRALTRLFGGVIDGKGARDISAIPCGVARERYAFTPLRRLRPRLLEKAQRKGILFLGAFCENY